MPFNANDRRIVKRWYKESARKRRCHVGANINNNAAIRAVLDTFQRNGKLGVRLSGMDCDCTSYYREYTMSEFTSVAAFKRYWDHHVEWLDGPETREFCRPEEIIPQSRSRDLAMEAYEDGHPSTVYYRSA